MSNPRNATLPRGERLIIRISPGSLSFTTTGAGQVNYERYSLKSSISMAANMREALRNTGCAGRRLPARSCDDGLASADDAGRPIQ